MKPLVSQCLELFAPSLIGLGFCALMIFAIGFCAGLLFRIHRERREWLDEDEDAPHAQ